VSFNRIKSGDVTGLLTGHNTLKRYLYIMGMINSPLGKRCGVEEETSAHILCEYKALVTIRHSSFGSCFLDPEDVKRARSRGNLKLY
jgi:hypothetical protein